MGLDMYLNDKDGIEVIYWRKANAIHKWFVDNVQAGVDDCGTYPVTRDHLTQLRDKCMKILQHGNLYEGVDRGVAEEELPTTDGFFFGSTDYDGGYIEDLRETIRMIEEVLDSKENEFYYHSSW